MIRCWVGSYRCDKCHYAWDYVMYQARTLRDCENCGRSNIFADKEVAKVKFIFRTGELYIKYFRFLSKMNMTE